MLVSESAKAAFERGGAAGAVPHAYTAAVLGARSERAGKYGQRG